MAKKAEEAEAREMGMEFPALEADTMDLFSPEIDRPLESIASDEAKKMGDAIADRVVQKDVQTQEAPSYQVYRP